MKFLFNKIKLTGTLWFLLCWLVLAVLTASNAQANGGSVVYSEDTGPFNVIVIASPSPPNPNVPLHLNILVTKASSPTRVTDASVIVDPTMPGMEMPGVQKLRTYPGATPNTYDVDIPVNMEGMWRVEITIVSPQYGQTTFPLQIEIKKPDAPWPVIVAILLGLPILAGITWFFLFRQSDKDGDDDDEEVMPVKRQPKKAPKANSERG